MKHPIRLLALDLDGTSLNAAKHITPAVRQALLDAMAAGVTVVPASGRPLTGLSEEFLALPGVNYAPDLQRRGGVPALRPRAHL